MKGIGICCKRDAQRSVFSVDKSNIVVAVSVKIKHGIFICISFGIHYKFFLKRRNRISEKNFYMSVINKNEIGKTVDIEINIELKKKS